MNRQQAIEAYRRVKALEHTMSERLRQTILIPYFGENTCRQHNCAINYDLGIRESPVNGKNHKELAHLSRMYDYEQERIWDVTGRLASYFAKFF